MRDSHDYAWLAGFWDGEGSVTLARRRQPDLHRFSYPMFTLSQAGDEGYDLCRRVLDIAGSAGRVHGPYPNGPRGKKPIYVARVFGGKRVADMLENCRPWLSRTKIAQAEAALDAWQACRRPGQGERKTHCPQGHPYDELNTRWHKNTRQCRTCHRACEARRRARIKQASPAPPRVWSPLRLHDAAAARVYVAAGGSESYPAAARAVGLLVAGADRTETARVVARLRRLVNLPPGHPAQELLLSSALDPA